MLNRYIWIFAVLFTTIAMRAVSFTAQDSNKGTVVIGSLMWTIEPNGQNVNRETANKYCQGVKLGGYADWRLPTIDELQAVYDPQATTAFRIKSPLQLKSCCLWSSTVLVEDGDKRRRFEPSRYAWGLYFDSGGVRYYSAMNFTDGQVLCVRPAPK
jgi:hypothetical protein